MNDLDIPSRANHIAATTDGVIMLPLVLPFPDIDPALFTIELGSFQFSLRWYALAYIGGLILGWRMMVWLMNRPTLWPLNRAPMRPEEPEELLTWMVLGVVLGGRLGFVLFYNPAYYAQNPLEILQVWNGGMSFHGGFLGVVIATILFTRAKGMPLWQAADAVALATPTGLLFGRLANFINGELYGRTTDVWWAMQFPTIGPDGQRDWDNLTEPRHPSQLYEAFLEGLVLLIVMWSLALNGGLKRPSLMVGLFFFGYGLSRFMVEFVRQWDPQLSEMVASYGITMGQVLSLPMIVIGLLMIANAYRRPALA
ncbi:MAG: prolipoprotein diacylglyceryl transferase [Pseudomonadota bacterium]